MSHRIALIHDALLHDGGSERVLLAMSALLPTADIYTSLAADDSLTFQQLKDRTQPPLISCPWPKKLSSLLKPYIYIVWESLDLSNYDLVISSSHSYSAKSVITSPKTLHVSYCHTPPKFLYGYATQSKKLTTKLQMPGRGIVLNYLRQLDYVAAQRVDHFIANSQTVQARIKAYYRRDSTVIYPPVAVPKTVPKRSRSVSGNSYYIVVSRLERPKHVELAIEVCNNRQENLLVIGAGSQQDKLRTLAGPTVKLLGTVSDTDKWKYLRQAKGFIMTAESEDFGISVVEAMAQGVPVIASRSGGTTETVLENVTGVFFNSFTAESLNKAINQFERGRFSRRACHRQAQRFSQQQFNKLFKAFLLSYEPDLSF